MHPTQRRADVSVMPAGTLDPLLTHIVEQHLSDTQPLNILDAGCGRMWTWDLGMLKFRLTGIDTDADSLRLRVETRGDLNDWSAGDLRTIALEGDSYDLVHSAYVLEHIDGAEQVLDQMLRATRPGGLIVVRIPDRGSVYSFLTRLAPHTLHVLYKRYIRKRPNAGKPGYGPYPVVYDRIVSLPGVSDWAVSRGIEVVAVVGDNSHLKFFGSARRIVDLGLRTVSLLSFGRLTARYSNLAFVMIKPT